MDPKEVKLREELRIAVKKARDSGLSDERVSLAIAGTLVALKAEGYVE